MKKLVQWSILLLVGVSLAACATPATKTGQKVKCPACGYEFEITSPPGN